MHDQKDIHAVKVHGAVGLDILDDVIALQFVYYDPGLVDALGIAAVHVVLVGARDGKRTDHADGLLLRIKHLVDQLGDVVLEIALTADVNDRQSGVLVKRFRHDAEVEVAVGRRIAAEAHSLQTVF